MFYKVTRKNLVIDGLVLGLVTFSVLKSHFTAPTEIGFAEFYWMVLAAGVFLVRWAYLSWSYFYSENANKIPGVLFKVCKVWVTFIGVISIIAYFVFIFFFLYKFR